MTKKYLATATLPITISLEVESDTEAKIKFEMHRLLIAKILHEADLNVKVK